MIGWLRRVALIVPTTFVSLSQSLSIIEMLVKKNSNATTCPLLAKEAYRSRTTWSGVSSPLCFLIVVVAPQFITALDWFAFYRLPYFRGYFYLLFAMTQT
jgi:hypothetical protein